MRVGLKVVNGQCNTLSPKYPIPTEWNQWNQWKLLSGLPKKNKFLENTKRITSASIMVSNNCLEWWMDLICINQLFSSRWQQWERKLHPTNHNYVMARRSELRQTVLHWPGECENYGTARRDLYACLQQQCLDQAVQRRVYVVWWKHWLFQKLGWK